MLELTRPVTQETDGSNDNESNKEDNTKVTDNKLNEDTEEKVGNADTNNTVLELSESPTNTRMLATRTQKITMQN